MRHTQTFLDTPNSVSVRLSWPRLHNPHPGVGPRLRLLTPLGWFAVSAVASVMIGAALGFAI